MFAQESAGGVRAVDLGNFTAMRGHLHRAFFGTRTGVSTREQFIRARISTPRHPRVLRSTP